MKMYRKSAPSQNPGAQFVRARAVRVENANTHTHTHTHPHTHTRNACHDFTRATAHGILQEKGCAALQNQPRTRTHTLHKPTPSKRMSTVHKSHLKTEIQRGNAGAQSQHLDQALAFSHIYRKSTSVSLSVDTLLGNHRFIYTLSYSTTFERYYTFEYAVWIYSDICVSISLYIYILYIYKYVLYIILFV